MTRNAEIDARENGKEFDPEHLKTVDEEGSEAEAPKEQTKEEKIKAMSNEEYLKKTVMPVLYQGMKSTSAHRPNDPLKYLAYYLLKN